ncbi:hypothetical protein INT48_009772 [Thamnidium elegans]|uniref:Uncharacterized protein n=1 Tax=Thamnidium elegans TaxID=101142 RepID=A0A8H7SQX1_9FUNG|nr:hypothetical protein INT48_009772 [Thamnidium elegans]
MISTEDILTDCTILWSIGLVSLITATNTIVQAILCLLEFDKGLEEFGPSVGQSEETTFTQDEAFTNIPKASKISAEPVPTDTEAIATVSLHHAIESLYPEHSNTDNQMITNIITSLNLAPFIINSDCIDNSKLEVTTLTTPSQHKLILDVKTRGIKRVKLDTPVENAVIQSTDCIHLSKISKDISFNEVIRKSTYHQVLAFEEHRHITEKHLDLLNSHWRKCSFMYMATSQSLAGAILVDGSQALLLNGVDSYSRYPSIDAHFENISSTQESSIPQLSSQIFSYLLIFIPLPFPRQTA